MTIEDLDRDASHTFTILRKGWEMDNTGWIYSDGRIFGTNCGHPYEMTSMELELNLMETEMSASGIKYALLVSQTKGVSAATTPGRVAEDSRHDV